MRVLPLALVLLSSACTVAAIGDDPAEQDGTPTPTPDPDPDPDPRPDPDPDPDPGATDTCPPADLGTIDTLKDPSAIIDRMDPDDPESPAVRLLHGIVAPDSEIEIGLWDGYGAFADSPAAPGSYPIAGDDADPSLCGLCVELSVTSGEVERRLFATGGALDVESVDGTLSGSGSSLTLEEIDGQGEMVAGGCRSVIDRIDFSATLEPP
jgi:hypothetical protein